MTDDKNINDQLEDEFIDDDFDDIDLSDDMDDAYDDEFGDEFDDEWGDEDFDDGSAPKKKSKSGLIIIGGGLIAGIIVIIYVMGTGTPAPAPTPEQQAEAEQVQVAPAEQAEAVVPQPTPIQQPETAQTAAQPEQVAEDAPQQAASEQPKAPPASPLDIIYGRTPEFEEVKTKESGEGENTGFFNDESMFKDVASEEEALTPLPEEVEEAVDMEFPSIEDVMVVDTEGVSGTPEAPQDAPALSQEVNVPQETEKAPAMSSDFQEQLSENINTIMARLESLDNKITSLENGAAEKSDLASLEKKIRTLEKKVTSRPVAAPAPAKKSTEPKSSSNANNRAAEQKRTPVSRVPQTRTVTTSWILKGAQPGQAMLGQKGSREVYTVTVGEKISSLGEIKSIETENGKWVVRGTKGEVRQP